MLDQATSEMHQKNNKDSIESFFIVATYPYSFCWTDSQYISHTDIKSFTYRNGYISSEDGTRYLKIEKNKNITFTTIQEEASKVELEYTDISTNFRIKHNDVYVRHDAKNTDVIYCEKENNDDPLFKNYSTWIFIPTKIDYDHEFVIAKFHEDISWTRYLPGNVIIYDKSNQDISFKHRGNIKVIRAQNIGREAHTYLYHIILNIRDKNIAERTTFLQGDPFPHSPNILELCCMSKDYADVQSLSSWYKHSEAGSVPDNNTIKNSLQYLNGAKFSYFTMREDGRFKTYDDAGWDARGGFYKNVSPQDFIVTNPIEYVYTFCGLHRKIQKEFLMVISAMFSVKKENILTNPLSAYNMLMQYLLRSDQQGGFEVYVLERIWYTLFSLTTLP